MLLGQGSGPCDCVSSGRRLWPTSPVFETLTPVKSLREKKSAGLMVKSPFPFQTCGLSTFDSREGAESQNVWFRIEIEFIFEFYS